MRHHSEPVQLEVAVQQRLPADRGFELVIDAVDRIQVLFRVVRDHVFRDFCTTRQTDVCENVLEVTVRGKVTTSKVLTSLPPDNIEEIDNAYLDSPPRTVPSYD